MTTNENKTIITLTDSIDRDFGGLRFTQLLLTSGGYKWCIIVDESVPRMPKIMNVTTDNNIDESMFDSYIQLSVRVVAKLYSRAKKICLHQGIKFAASIDDKPTGDVLELSVPLLTDVFDREYELVNAVEQPTENHYHADAKSLGLHDKTEHAVSETDPWKLRPIHDEDYELLNSVKQVRAKDKRVVVTLSGLTRRHSMISANFYLPDDREFVMVIDTRLDIGPILQGVSGAADITLTMYQQYLAALLVCRLASGNDRIAINRLYANWIKSDEFAEVKGILNVESAQGFIYIDSAKAMTLFEEQFEFVDDRDETVPEDDTLNRLDYKGSSKELLNFARTVNLVLLEVIGDKYFFTTGNSFMLPIHPVPLPNGHNYTPPDITAHTVITLCNDASL